MSRICRPTVFTKCFFKLDEEYVFSFLQAIPFVEGINGALVGSQSPSEQSGREQASFLAVFIYLLLLHSLTQVYNEL